MAIRTSTGLKQAMMTHFGLGPTMGYGVIKVYTGDQPASPNLAYSGSHIGTITQNGLAFVPGDTSTGLLLENTLPGSISKLGVWRLKGSATGTAGWFRYYRNGIDLGTFSTYLPRIDGSVGTANADLILASTTITPSTDVAIDEFRLLMIDIQIR